MEAFTIVAVWLSTLVGGALIAIGLTTFFTGRAVINLQPTNWSLREARLLGLCSAIQGAVVAAYALYGGLTVVLHVIPLLGVGSPWVMFVSAPFGVIMLATLWVQAAVQLGHRESRRTKGR